MFYDKKSIEYMNIEVVNMDPIIAEQGALVNQNITKMRSTNGCELIHLKVLFFILKYTLLR